MVRGVGTGERVNLKWAALLPLRLLPPPGEDGANMLPVRGTLFADARPALMLSRPLRVAGPSEREPSHHATPGRRSGRLFDAARRGLEMTETTDSSDINDDATRPIYPDMLRATALTISALSFAAIPVAFAISFIYNWGFFSAFRISMGATPMTLADHLNTWPLWLPETILVGFLICALMFFSSRKRYRSPAGSPPAPENVERNTRRMGLIFAAFSTMGVALVLLSAWGSELQPPLTAGIGLCICWAAYTVWILSYPDAKTRYSAPARNFIYWAPMVAISMFFWGWSEADSVYFGQPDVYVVHMGAKQTQSPPEPLTVEVIRTFEKWMLVYGEGGKIVWLRIDNLYRFDLKENRLSL